MNVDSIDSQALATTPAPSSVQITVPAPTAQDIAGGLKKKDFLASAKIAGVSRGDAERAFNSALSEHRQNLTATVGASLGAGWQAVRLKAMKCGDVSVRLTNPSKAKAKEDEKTAARIAKLESQLAALKAK